MSKQIIRKEEFKRAEKELFLTLKKTYLELKAAIKKARDWGNAKLEELDEREKELDENFEKIKKHFN